jgi:hypothetical protein
MKQNQRVNLSTFTKCSKFYGQINVFFTVKKITDKKSAICSEGLWSAKLQNGALNRLQCMAKDKGCRGVTLVEDDVIYATNDTICSVNDNSRNKLPNTGRIHSLDYQNNCLLVTSTENNALLEIDMISKEEFNRIEINNQELLASNNKMQTLFSRNELKLLCDGTKSPFVNHAIYSDNRILFTALNHGSLFEFDSKYGIRVIKTGLSSPHSIKSVPKKNRFIVVDTCKNDILLFGTICCVFHVDVTNTESRCNSLNLNYWLQSACFHNNLIITVDSVSNHFILFDYKQKKYDKISFDSGVRIHEVMTK